MLRAETCVILCGGKSSRMGRNKALLPFGELSLLAYLFEKYKSIFGEVYLCSKKIYREEYEKIGAKILYEESEIFAPMIGLQASLKQLQKKVFFVTTDCPFLQERHFLALEDVFLKHSRSIVYAKTKNKSHFLIGIYSPCILPNLEEYIQKMDFKMSSFIQSCNAFALEFEDEESFENLNTPSEYQNALLRIKNGR